MTAALMSVGDSNGVTNYIMLGAQLQSYAPSLRAEHAVPFYVGWNQQLNSVDIPRTSSVISIVKGNIGLERAIG